MSVAGQPAKNLNRAARNFTTALAAKPPGGLPPDRYWPAYGAQAASAALSAIARSDGTREGVRKALFSTHLHDGLRANRLRPERRHREAALHAPAAGALRGRHVRCRP